MATTPGCARRSPKRACAMWRASPDHLGLAARAAPSPPPPASGRGRSPKLLRRDRRHQPIGQGTRHRPAGNGLAACPLARGQCGLVGLTLSMRAVRPAHRDTWLSEPRPEEGPSIEWPQGEPEPTSIGWRCARGLALDPLVDLASCAGGSSATTRSSSRNSASAITKGAVARLSPPCDALDRRRRLSDSA